MMGHTGLEHVGLAAVRLLPWVNALRSLLPLSPLRYFFFSLLVEDRGAFESF